jgi:hypothetical protein
MHRGLHGRRQGNDVSPDPHATRRYLLGQADEEEAERLEREYLGSQEAADRLADAEQDLIEDYLDGRLAAPDREQLERHYLASPAHRTRVELARHLRRAAAAARTEAHGASVRTGSLPYGRLALAAGLLLAIGAAWFSTNRPAIAPPVNQPAVTTREPAPSVPESAPVPAPRMFAMSLSPAGTRSAGESPSLRVPGGTDVILLRLEGEGGREAVVASRVVVRLVSGEEIWQGPAIADADLPPGVLAHAEIPAERLSPDDYVVVLFATDEGAERERYRYFLRVLTSSPPGA